MITNKSRQSWLVILLGFCLCGASAIHAQQRSTTGQSQFRGNNSFSPSSSSSSSSGSTRDYINNTMIGDATVTVDPETRRVIVVTDDQTAANISQVISNLDHPKPQVLIKVVFLEVQHS